MPVITRMKNSLSILKLPLQSGLKEISVATDFILVAERDCLNRMLMGDRYSVRR